MDLIHRILSGQTLTETELRFAGRFVLFWFAIDFIQFVDFVIKKMIKLFG